MMRYKAQILVSICGFSVDFDWDSAILISLYECVEEGDGRIFFHFHGKFRFWMLAVDVLEELFKVASA